jgi:thioredoxin-related protein
MLAACTLSFKTGDKYIKFDNRKWSDVTKQAKDDNKPIFAMVCASWCSNCARMKAEVFNDPEVASFFNEHFVNTMIDSEDFKSNMRATNWGVKAVPTMVFLDSHKKVIYKTSGYRTSAKLLEEAQKALDDMSPR